MKYTVDQKILGQDIHLHIDPFLAIWVKLGTLPLEIGILHKFERVALQ